MYNGSALRFYRDGMLVRTTATTGVITPGTGPLRIGGNSIWGEYFAGTIDEVRVYNRALTASEIQVDMATPVGGATPDTTPPSASVTAPAQGASVSGVVTLQAAAEDNVQVAGVRFLVDGGAIGSEDTSAPYSAGLDTRTLSNGSHTIAALARDGSGNQATSPAVTVTVDNPPQLVITSPAQGQSVPGTTLAITYTTIGDLNGVDHVHFQLNANPEVMDLTLDGVYQMANVPAGASILYGWLVRANHSKIPGTDAAPVSFSASGPDATPPLVILTAPGGGATVAGVVQVTADATDAGGVAGVQFLLDGVNLGVEDSTAPYAIAWDTATATTGNHTLAAVARDAAGNTTRTADVPVTVARGETGRPGLVLALGFNENAGSTAADASGRNNHASLGGATWVAGKHGAGLSFDGTASLVTVANSAGLNPTGALTLEAWIKPTTLNGWRTVLMKEAAGDLIYTLYAYDNAPRPAVYIHTTTELSIPGTAAPPLNAWTHLAATYRRRSAAAVQKRDPGRQPPRHRCPGHLYGRAPPSAATPCGGSPLAGVIG